MIDLLVIRVYCSKKTSDYLVVHCFFLFMPISESLLSLFAQSLFLKEQTALLLTKTSDLLEKPSFSFLVRKCKTKNCHSHSQTFGSREKFFNFSTNRDLE